MPHKIALQTTDNHLLAWGINLPGLIAGAPDDTALKDALPRAIADHLAWLSRHGEDSGHDTSWQIVETLHTNAFASTGGELCFDTEKQHLSLDDLGRYIARMDFARTDLLATSRDLPDTILDWEPPASAIGEPDPWSRDPRTIRGITKHVLQLELYYRESLRDGPAPGIFEPVRDEETERLLTTDRLHSMSDEDRSRVWQAVHPGRTVAEEWTVRKVIRRIISHERAHAAEVEQRLTWPLLGIPRLREVRP